MIRDETQLTSPERFRALDGRLYMPSYPWGVDYFSRMADDIHHIGSDTTLTKCEAMRRHNGGSLATPRDPPRFVTDAIIGRLCGIGSTSRGYSIRPPL